MDPITGLALGGGLISGGISAWGANKGADAMADAIEQAVALQQEQMRLAKREYTPYADAGRESLTQYQQNIGNQPTYKNTLANLVNDPGYQFRLQQGQQDTGEQCGCSWKPAFRQHLEGLGHIRAGHGVTGRGRRIQPRYELLQQQAESAGEPDAAGF